MEEDNIDYSLVLSIANSANEQNAVKGGDELDFECIFAKSIVDEVIQTLIDEKFRIQSESTQRFNINSNSIDYCISLIKDRFEII